MMSGPHLGGSMITKTEWLGPNALQVTFRAEGYSTHHFQCYVGKRLAAFTSSPSARSLVVDVPYSKRATPLTMMAVEPAQRGTDYSSHLEWKPWNFYCINWNAPDPLPADIDRYEVVMSTVAGGAYDTSNVIGVVPHETGRTAYSFSLPAIESTGDWQVAVIPRDNTKPSGNAGTAQSSTIAAVVYPLDLALDSEGRRFTVTVSGGTATALFTCST